MIARRCFYQHTIRVPCCEQLRSQMQALSGPTVPFKVSSSCVSVSFVACPKQAALAHFLRLSETDRHMRFLQFMSDQAIDGYVSQIDFSKAICFGMFDADQRLIAMAEALPYRAGTRSMAEAAFSTDEGWRRHGLARRLCESLGEHARSTGVDRVVLHCHRRNAAMRGLLRAIDAVTTIDDGDLEAEWDTTL